MPVNVFPPSYPQIIRLGGDIVMGLGSIVGSGVFIGIALVAGIAGNALLVGIVMAGLLALGTGVSSTQLIVTHPASEKLDTRVYSPGNLNVISQLPPLLSYLTGWVGIVANMAAVATAALGIASYGLVALGGGGRQLTVPVAVAVAVVMSGLLVTGRLPRWGQQGLAILVLVVILGLVGATIPTAITMGSQHLTLVTVRASGLVVNPIVAVCQATALMVVAYGSYESLPPHRLRPNGLRILAMVLTLVLALGLYMAVALVSMAAVGAPVLSAALTTGAAPLEFIARSTGVPGLAPMVAIAAIIAMAVMISHLLGQGLAVILGMGHRGDLPLKMAQPWWAMGFMGGGICLFILTGSLQTTWMVSALARLLYYALTHWATVQLPAHQRRYPQWLGWVGVGSCLGLAFCLDRGLVGAGALLLVIGALGYGLAHKQS